MTAPRHPPQTRTNDTPHRSHRRRLCALLVQMPWAAEATTPLRAENRHPPLAPLFGRISAGRADKISTVYSAQQLKRVVVQSFKLQIRWRNALGLISPGCAWCAANC